MYLYKVFICLTSLYVRGVDLNEYIISLKSKEYISAQRLHFCEEYVPVWQLYSCLRYARYCYRLENFSVTTRKWCRNTNTNSFSPMLNRLWRFLPVDCFPLINNLIIIDRKPPHLFLSFVSFLFLLLVCSFGV